MSSSHRHPLQNLLRRPIAFHPVFVEYVGVTGALMISQAIYWSERLPEDRDGWFYKTMAEWQEETGLTRTEQETARKRLVEIGFLSVNKKGVPAKLWYKVEFVAIDREVFSLQDSCKQECRIRANKNAENMQTNTETTTETTNNKAKALQKVETVIAGSKPRRKGPDKSVSSVVQLFQSVMDLPMLDGSVKENRRYASLLLRKFGGEARVGMLIKQAGQDSFWKSKLTSLKLLYNHAVQIMSKTRETEGRVAVIG